MGRSNTRVYRKIPRCGSKMPESSTTSQFRCSSRSLIITHRSSDLAIKYKLRKRRKSSASPCHVDASSIMCDTVYAWSCKCILRQEVFTSHRTCPPLHRTHPHPQRWHPGTAGTQTQDRSCKWGEASEEEMKTWEWNKIYSKLTKVRVELTREANAASHTGHAC